MIKVGFHVEDETDEFALKLLLERMLEVRIESALQRHRVGGIGTCLKGIGDAFNRFYWQGVTGAVFAVDNDGEPRHEASHQQDDKQVDCRFCRLTEEVARAEQRLKSQRSGSPMLRVIGVPVEAIEAWALFAADLDSGKPERHPDDVPRQKLKHALYGTDRPRRESKMKKFDTIFASNEFRPGHLAAASPSFSFFARQIDRWRDDLPDPEPAGGAN